MKASSAQSGFSLVEVLIAMVVTVIVTGAVYGLMAGGQNAFRREPELIDRQQNIRNAMSILEEDLRTAGYGMPAYTQVFTGGLDDIAGTLQSIVVPGEHTDGLEFLAGDWNCPAIPVCAANTVPDPMAVKVPVDSACLPPAGAPGLLLMTTVNDIRKPVPGIDASLIVGGATRVALAGAPAGCVGKAQFNLSRNQGPASWHPGLAGVTRYMVLPVRVIKYQIAIDPTDPNGLPKLWRSVTGGRSAASGYATAVVPGVDTTWQLVAEGVEDLQVQYMSGPIVDPNPVGWTDEPAPIAAGNGESLTRRVRVTISARAATLGQGGIARGTGSITAPLATDDIKRGQLTSIVTPRQIVFALEATDALR